MSKSEAGNGMTERKLPSWFTAAVIAGTLAALVWLERRRPLRPHVESKTRRGGRNLTVAALSGLAMRVVEAPVVSRLPRWVERHRLGVLKLVRLPAWLEVMLAVAMLDYTLYLWHVLTHRVPWLWRLHVVHHADLDLDATTALRFHFAEMVVSVPWRAAQIAVIGVSPLALSLWQTLLFVSILFHHSEVRLPIGFERALSRLIVTPRMHGIHHSMVREEADSNWSSGFTLWDWLHGTLRLNVPQGAVVIGVPAYRELDRVTLPKIVAMPFVPQPPTWRLPADGAPVRARLSTPPIRLMA